MDDTEGLCPVSVALLGLDPTHGLLHGLVMMLVRPANVRAAQPPTVVLGLHHEQLAIGHTALPQQIGQSCQPTWMSPSGCSTTLRISPVSSILVGMQSTRTTLMPS